ncbi:MAG: DUF2442 domain-containing protein [Rectinemataceae bacterium]
MFASTVECRDRRRAGSRNVASYRACCFLCYFENGERRIFDAKPLLALKPFDRLKDPRLFSRTSIDYGTVVWPGNIDIAPETLYMDSTEAVYTNWAD